MLKSNLSILEFQSTRTLTNTMNNYSYIVSFVKDYPRNEDNISFATSAHDIYYPSFSSKNSIFENV